jgi:hypothetical protein
MSSRSISREAKTRAAVQMTALPIPFDAQIGYRCLGDCAFTDSSRNTASLTQNVSAANRNPLAIIMVKK